MRNKLFNNTYSSHDIDSPKFRTCVPDTWFNGYTGVIKYVDSEYDTSAIYYYKCVKLKAPILLY